MSLYTDDFISVAIENYLTSPIKVHSWVLQGDSLPPLLFNMIVNTLITTIKQEKLKCMGCVYDGGVQPTHWMQCGEDIAIATALESDNQLLYNGFLQWSSWTELIVRVDKCSVFGMRKSKSESVQYQPYVTMNRERFRPRGNGDSFTYLEKEFNFNMNCDRVKENLMKTIRDFTNRIDTTTIHTLCQIEMCQKYVYLKIKWDLPIHDLSKTWVNENIDSHLN